MTVTTRAATRRRIHVGGVVQGVGFRPHVHRLAQELDLTGFVGNDSSGVVIEVEGRPRALEVFHSRLIDEAPPLAHIEAVTTDEIDRRGDTAFTIVASTTSTGRTLIPPDVAVCDECMAEVGDPSDRRYRYPFTNCTNCGPRFTIITGLPYDRPATTMAGFAMCPDCRAEYEDPADRRYHAQPVACPRCGPRLRFEAGGGDTVCGDAVCGDAVCGDAVCGTDAAIAAFHAAIAAGQIVAVKGLGGYHLACDATNDASVAELRSRKGRADKPLALMVADLAAASELALIDSDAADALTSPARPIVLLPARTGTAVSPLVAPGHPLLGVMLPYSPLHHLLFRATVGGTAAPLALVMTSGNVVDEPICYRDGEATERLGHLVDAFLTHDRPIQVPCDDSVVRVVQRKVQPVRRSRGFAPLPVSLPVAVAPTLAVGGELKNTFCVASGRHAWVSQHVGDMGNMETIDAFERSVEGLCRMYQVTPTRWAADAHPGYATTRWAERHAPHPITRVQHHHAHVAALMAESGLDGSTPVIGVAFDGTGYATGPDGRAEVWGGEVLLADYESSERAGHLRPLPLPGGDAAVYNPCRVAVAYLAALGIERNRRLPSVGACDAVELTLVERQLATGTAMVSTSSMGRLFDAVASLLGVRHRVTYEAQAAVELEALAATSAADPFAANWAFSVDEDLVLDPGPLLRHIATGVLDGGDPADLALGFHRAVAHATVAVATRLRRARGSLPVLLTGGVFQNALLTNLTVASLEQAGFETHTHRLVPPNDGGLSLGQAVIAGYRRGRPCA